MERCFDGHGGCVGLGFLGIGGILYMCINHMGICLLCGFSILWLLGFGESELCASSDSQILSVLEVCPREGRGNLLFRGLVGLGRVSLYSGVRVFT